MRMISGPRAVMISFSTYSRVLRTEHVSSDRLSTRRFNMRSQRMVKLVGSPLQDALLIISKHHHARAAPIADIPRSVTQGEQ